MVSALDRAVPVEQQEGMIRNARESAFDVVEKLQSGHEPTLGKIRDLVGVEERAAKGGID